MLLPPSRWFSCRPDPARGLERPILSRRVGCSSYVSRSDDFRQACPLSERRRREAPRRRDPPILSQRLPGLSFAHLCSFAAGLGLLSDRRLDLAKTSRSTNTLTLPSRSFIPSRQCVASGIGLLSAFLAPVWRPRFSRLCLRDSFCIVSVSHLCLQENRNRALDKIRFRGCLLL